MYTFTLVLRQTHQWTLRLIVTLVKFQAHFARLSGRIRDNPKLTIRTTLAVYRACVFSTLLYGSKTWTLLTMQEKKVNTFHQRFLRHIFRIRWQHKITNEEVLRRTGLTTIYITLMSVPYVGRSRKHKFTNEIIKLIILYFSTN